MGFNSGFKGLKLLRFSLQSVHFLPIYQHYQHKPEADACDPKCTRACNRSLLHDVNISNVVSLYKEVYILAF